MIKECPVILNNDVVTVVKFGDTEIQFSSIMKDVKTVKVKYENGKYSIVNHAEEPKAKVKAPKPLLLIRETEHKQKKTIKEDKVNVEENKDCIEV